jgi:hypothetical protein
LFFSLFRQYDPDNGKEIYQGIDEHTGEEDRDR